MADMPNIIWGRPSTGRLMHAYPERREQRCSRGPALCRGSFSLMVVRDDGEPCKRCVGLAEIHKQAATLLEIMQAQPELWWAVGDFPGKKGISKAMHLLVFYGAAQRKRDVDGEWTFRPVEVSRG